MHTLNFDPRQRLLVGAVAFLATLLVVLIAAQPLGTLDFSIRSGDGAPAAPAAPAPVMAAEPTGNGAPTWVTDPLAPPFDYRLRGSGG